MVVKSERFLSKEFHCYCPLVDDTGHEVFLTLHCPV